MSEQTAPESTTETPDDTTPETPDTEHGTEEEQKNPAARQAAKYRRQLRDTETERDSLRERVTAYERAEVERLAVDLADPADLWVSGIELDTLRGEDGAIDQGKVKAAIAELLEQRPHWKKTLPPLAPPASLVSGATGMRTAPGASWSDVFSQSRETL